MKQNKYSLTVQPPSSVSISQKTEWLSPNGYIVYSPLSAPGFLLKTSAQSDGSDVQSFTGSN